MSFDTSVQRISVPSLLTELCKKILGEVPNRKMISAFLKRIYEILFHFDKEVRDFTFSH